MVNDSQLKYMIDLNELRYVWRTIPTQGLLQHCSFQKLGKLEIYKCDKLRYVFSACMAKLLVNLKEIEIHSCEMMEQVMIIEEEESLEVEKKLIEFPKLAKMDLRELPSM